ncbi:hypothetical protein ACEPPN_005221 [Leptodophora sp. 'Broadleaf-Isolate-01']
MHLFAMLLSVLLTFIFQPAVSLPQAVMSVGSFNAIWINTPGRITRFESTIIVPAVSPARNVSSGQALRSVWAGLQSADLPRVLQNVIDSLSRPSQDLATIRARRNPQSAEYFDNWLIKPGPAGNVSGVHPNGGGITTNGGFNKTYSWSTANGLAPASGDFGVVKWKNIIVEAETNSTEWCTKLPDGNGQFKWTRSDPVATVDPDRNTTTCYFASFTFLGKSSDV